MKRIITEEECHVDTLIADDLLQVAQMLRMAEWYINDMYHLAMTSGAQRQVKELNHMLDLLQNLKEAGLIMAENRK